MKCFKCGNDIEDNLECPFCGYINKEEPKKDIRLNYNKNNNIEKNDIEYGNNKIKNKITNIICKILCYLQVSFSIMMVLVCLSLDKPFFPLISWVIVTLVFIPKIKQAIIEKNPKIKKWIIAMRVILIILAMIIFITNLPQIYEDEWVSNSGINVNLKDSVATVIEDNIEYHGSYKTQYVDEITNIYVSCGNKKFIFYFKYNDNVVEFYYMKDNEKIYLIPINKNSNYIYIEN